MPIRDVKKNSDSAKLRAVFSSLSATSANTDPAEIENYVMKAFGLLKSNGENPSGLRIKEVAVELMRGGITETTVSPDGTINQGPVTGTPDGSNIFRENALAVRRGEGHPSLGQPYGVERRHTEAAQMQANPSFSDSSMDFLGTTTWNFVDSLLVGLPGLALNKIMKPNLGKDNGVVSFLEGARRSDTDAGKWGEGLGILASFIGPGGLIGGGSKAGRVIAKGNLVGRVFGSGGKAVRSALGVTGKIEKFASVGGKVIADAEIITKDIKRTKSVIKTLTSRGELINKEVKTVKTALKEGITNKDALTRAEKLLAKNETRLIEETKRLDKLNSVSKSQKSVSKVVEDELKKIANAAYAERRAAGTKEMTQLVNGGMKKGIENSIKNRITGRVAALTGSMETAESITAQVLKATSRSIDDVINGTKTWGEVVGELKFMHTGFGSRIGKIIQNGTEEAIGFAAHSSLLHTIKGLSDAPDYNLETLKDIASGSATSAVHSAGTAFIFASGGGIPLLNQAGLKFILPMKLLLPSRKTHLSEVLHSALGWNKAESLAFGSEITSMVNSELLINKTLNKFRRGIKKTGLNVMKSLRQRGIIDYHKLGAEDPRAIIGIAENVIKAEGMAGLDAINKASGIVPVSNLSADVLKLRKLLIPNSVNVGQEGAVLVKRISDTLSAQAERSVERNWRSISGAMKSDVWKNALTGASIFYGGGGGDMLKAVKNGTAHPSDVMTHLVFSLTSASHGIHLAPSQIINSAEHTGSLSVPEEHVLDIQNKVVLRMMGLDFGSASITGALDVSGAEFFGGDLNDSQSKKLISSFTEGEKSFEDLTVVPSDGRKLDSSSQVYTSDLVFAMDFLRQMKIKFKDDDPLNVLNDLIGSSSEESQREFMKSVNNIGRGNNNLKQPGPDLAGTDAEIKRIGGEVETALAFVAKKMREELMRKGIIDSANGMNIQLDSTHVMNYTNEFHRKAVKRLTDISRNGLERLNNILGTSGRVIKSHEFGRLPNEGTVGGVDPIDLPYMLDRFLNIAKTTDAGIGDYKDPVIIGGDKQEEVATLLNELNTQIKDSFNGKGLDDPVVVRALRGMVRAGFASKMTNLYLGSDTVSLAYNDESVGSTGFKPIEDAAKQRGFVEFVGNKAIVGTVNESELVKEGVPESQIREVSNFLSLLRVKYGYVGSRGKEITAEQLQKYYQNMPSTFNGITDQLSLKSLSIAYGIDYTNDVAVKDAAHAMMSANSSKVTRDQFEMFNLLRNISVVYDDPLYGFVHVKLKMEEDSPSGSVSNETASQLGEFRNKMVSEIENVLGPNGVDIFNEFINEELDPLFANLKEAGLLYGEAPNGSYGAVVQEYSGGSRPLSRLLEVINGRNYMKEENSRKATLSIIERIFEINKTKPFGESDFNYNKLNKIGSEIVYLLGKKSTSAYDWYKLSLAAKKIKIFANSVNPKELNAAIDEIHEELLNVNIVDSLVRAAETSGTYNDLGEFSHLSENHSSTGISLASFVGAGGLGYTRNELRSSSDENMTTVLNTGRSAAKVGLSEFKKFVKDAINAASASNKNSGDNKFSNPSEEEIISMFNSERGTAFQEIINIGDFSFENHDPENPSVKEGEKKFTVSETVEGSFFRQSKPGPRTILNDIASNRGIGVFLVNGTMSFNGTNYSIRKTHSEEIEKRKAAVLDQIRTVGFEYVEASGRTRQGKPLYVKGNSTRSVLLSFGDVDDLVGIRLPNNAKDGASFGRQLDQIHRLYDNGSRTGYFKDALDDLRFVADGLVSGKSIDGSGGGKNVYLKGLENSNKLETALRFMLTHDLLGETNMNNIPRDIKIDKAIETQTRFRQLLSRAFMPTNREAFEAASAGDALGYSDGQLRGVVVDDVDSSFLPSGQVTRGDGAIYYHSSINRAKARLNGIRHNDARNVGVVKDHLLLFDNATTDDGFTYNTGSFVTKNAGFSNIEMDKFLERHGLAFVVISPSAKIMGNVSTGRILDKKGNTINWIEAARGAHGSRIEGAFSIPIESLRINKIPHKANATIGYQIENGLSPNVVRNLIDTYFEQKIGGDAPNGMQALARIVNGTTPSARNTANRFVTEALLEAGAGGRSSIGIDGIVPESFSTYLSSSPLASPNDYFFSKKGMSIFNRRILQDNLFRAKDSSGRQDILAPDHLGSLNSGEAIGSHSSREIYIDDTFSKDSDKGITLAYELSGDFSEHRTKADIKRHYSIKKDEPLNYNTIDNPINEDNPNSAVEREMVKSSYVHRRMFRMNSVSSGSNSVFFDAIKDGLNTGKSSGVIGLLDKNVSDAQIMEINNFAIDLISRTVNTESVSSLINSVGRDIAVKIIEDVRNRGNINNTQTKVIDGKVNYGHLMDVANSILGEFVYSRKDIATRRSNDVQWGILGISQRYPSTKANDTIPTIFKGTLHKRMGNQVMLNYYDATIKGEADHDIDNFNYFFKINKDHMRELVKRRSLSGVNELGARQNFNETFGHVFNPFSQSDAMAYSKSDADSKRHRGKIIKSESLLAKMIQDQYKIKFTSSGVTYEMSPRYASHDELLSTKEGRADAAYSSKMVQEILDSKKSVLPKKRYDPSGNIEVDKYGDQLPGYGSKDFDPLSEIMKRMYEIKVIEKDGSGEINTDITRLESLHVDMLKAVIGPYRDLLTFSKDEWEGDRSGASDFSRMRDISIAFNSIYNKNTELNLSKIITSHLGKRGEGITGLSVSLNKSIGMAENGANAIVALDRISSDTGSSELFGRDADSVTELAEYVTGHPELNLNPTEADLVKLVGEIKTKNWHKIRNGNRINSLRSNIVYSRNMAANGSEFYERRARVLQSQYNELRSIEEAISRGKILDPDLFQAFDTGHEKSDSLRNSITVESFKMLLLNEGLDPIIMEEILNDARIVQKNRGIAWAKHLDNISRDNRDMYGEKKNAIISDDVYNFLSKWRTFNTGTGVGGITDDALIFALAISQPHGKPIKGNGKDFMQYKTSPADLFNKAVELVYGLGASSDVKLMSMYKKMAKAYSIKVQHMNGNSAELEEVVAMNRLRTSGKSIFNITSRLVNNRREIVTSANVIRRLNLNENESGEDGVNVSFENESAVGYLMGISQRSIDLIQEPNPGDLTQDALRVFVRSRKFESSLLFNSEGAEPVPYVNIYSTHDARYESDVDGVVYDFASEKLLRKNRDENRIKKSNKEKPDYIDSRSEKHERRVRATVDKINRNSLKFMNNEGAVVEPNDSLGNGASENVKDPIVGIVNNRNGRRKEGDGC